MERPERGAMAALRATAVLTVAFFFLETLRLLEDPLRATVNFLPQ
jgi:hypothetical protein